jgi:hypothetical protein
MQNTPVNVIKPGKIQLQRERHASLCEALDRVLDTGVVALGEVKLSVADVDLVYLGLQLVITSIRNQDDPSSPASNWKSTDKSVRRDDGYSMQKETGDDSVIELNSEPPSVQTAGSGFSQVKAKDVFPSNVSTSLMPEPSGNVTLTDPDKAKNGLGQLVLTVVKLLHELMKKQALRRIDSGELDAAQIERLGITLMDQAREMKRLQAEFGLKDEDLNLDLGALGKLF